MFGRTIDLIFALYYLGTKVSFESKYLKNKYFGILSISLFLFWTRYEVEITSLVTVKEETKPFLTWNDFFSAGYKLYVGICEENGTLELNYVCLNSNDPVDDAMY